MFSVALGGGVAGQRKFVGRVPVFPGYPPKGTITPPGGVIITPPRGGYNNLPPLGGYDNFPPSGGFNNPPWGVITPPGEL